MTKHRHPPDDAGSSPLAAALHEQALRHERSQDLDRRRLARLLHNELGQLLNAARMEIGRLDRLQQQGALAPAALDRLDELIAHAAGFARRLGRGLHPPALDLGIVPGLEALCEDFRVQTGLRCTLQAPDDVPLHDFVAQTVYRVAEQALAIVTQHARSTVVTLQLQASAQGLVLEVQDDSAGFAAETPPHAPALQGMGARARALGGAVDWQAADDLGTLVRLQLPASALALEGPECLR